MCQNISGYESSTSSSDKEASSIFSNHKHRKAVFLCDSTRGNAQKDKSQNCKAFLETINKKDEERKHTTACKIDLGVQRMIKEENTVPLENKDVFESMVLEKKTLR